MARFIRAVFVCLSAVLIAAAAAPLFADDEPQQATLFPPRGGSRFWVGGQANIITQSHGRFTSPYAGANSLDSRPERATSRVFTLFTTLRASRNTELIVDVESAGGRGIGNAFGLAGFTNLDVVRNPTLGARPYLARAQIHAVIALAGGSEPSERTFLSRLAELPTRRLELRAGKLGTPDFFDLNSAGSDSHLQFMNWTIDNNGAYDYAADTRGYTWGVVAELHVPAWTLRGGVMLMPAVANGIHYDHDVRHARGENVELEVRRPLLRGRATTARFLLYRNLARMGSYREALAARGAEAPDVTLSRRRGRTKLGAGINVEQELSDRTRAFARLGWSDGRNESFAYTEVDRTVQVGMDVRPFTRRPLDRIGAAVVANALSPAHRDYLAAGGVGFIIGDGALRYGHERIIEAYYTALLRRGVYASADLQAIRNPAYNRDRGPLLVASARLHVDF
jgi:high affinity Mn2+ porin